MQGIRQVAASAAMPLGQEQVTIPVTTHRPFSRSVFFLVTAVVLANCSVHAQERALAGLSPDAYKPGALVVVRPAPNDSLSHVPTENVGTFVYDGGEVSFTDNQTRGLNYRGPVAMDLQGFLKGDEMGTYEISADLKEHAEVGTATPSTCFMQTWIASDSIGQRSVVIGSPSKQDATASLRFYVDLQPGIYPLRAWLSCNVLEDVTTVAEFSIKSPHDRSSRQMNGRDLVRLDK